MNYFNLFLCASIFSSYALADVRVLNESELSNHTGQAGLMIDTDRSFMANEFEYVDAGLFDVLSVQVGGHGHEGGAFYTDRLDNLRINISLTDNNDSAEDEGFMYGFSEFRGLAETYLNNGNTVSAEAFKSLAQGVDSIRDGLAVDDGKRYEDGDLVIHYSYSDAWEKDGGYDTFKSGDSLSGNNFLNSTYQTAEELATRSVDFKYAINELGISYGSNALGGATNASGKNTSSLNSSAGANTTRLMSNFSMQGYLGPHDLHIKEYEQLDDNGITWNSYFRVTDLDVYFDLAGVQISDLEIHNNRGDLSGLNLATLDNSVGKSSFGFAHAQREIYAVETLVFEEAGSADSKKKKSKRAGIAFNTRFKGDIDINHMSFGDTGTSIGEFFITDMFFISNLTITPRD